MKRQNRRVSKAVAFLWREGGGVGIWTPTVASGQVAVDYTWPIRQIRRTWKKETKREREKSRMRFALNMPDYSRRHTRWNIMKENMWRLCQRSGASALAITAATQMLTFSSPLEGDGWLFSPERRKQRGSQRNGIHMFPSVSQIHLLSEAFLLLLDESCSRTLEALVNQYSWIVRYYNIIIIIFRICFYFYIFCLYLILVYFLKYFFISI